MAHLAPGESISKEVLDDPFAASRFTTPKMSKRQSDLVGNLGNGNLVSTIGNTDGCPISTKVALIGIVTDCSYTSSFTSREAVRESIIAMVNSASLLYENSFNIAIGLRNIIISDAECLSTGPEPAPWNIPCANGNLGERLDLFSTWRGLRQDDNAYWTLMTGCSTGNTVGIAWVGQLCSSELSTSIVVRTPTEWQVFA